VLKRLTYRFHAALERRFPERRLYLKSDAEMRFVRLTPAAQALSVVVGGAVFGWTVLATAILLMDSVGAADAAAQAQRQQAIYEARLTALSADRDLRADDAARAQDRFTLALAEVSAMQTRLLETEEARRELEKGVEVIQDTLRRVIAERDGARAEAQALAATLKRETGTARLPEARGAEAAATLGVLAAALSGTAAERDAMALAALAAEVETEAVEAEMRALARRNDAIFAKLEEAVSVSLEPLDAMFRSAGLAPDDILDTVRRGYSGQGGPLAPIAPAAAAGRLSPEELRANAILQGLDRLNLYRLAAEKTPLAKPVQAAFRFTSGFGYRRDPKGAGTRMHAGLDFAGAHGTPIHATGDGVVTHADWDSGYGRTVRIRHDTGIESVYAHLSQIRVNRGQRVSRGDRIGDMGSSGRSTGTHLHYEIRIGGRAVNPMPFIRAGSSNVF
jgi:murein DD-endopeptidase MepM/ murein hydrolase activator NlpD